MRGAEHSFDARTTEKAQVRDLLYRIGGCFSLARGGLDGDTRVEIEGMAERRVTEEARYRTTWRRGGKREVAEREYQRLAKRTVSGPRPVRSLQ